MTLIGSNRDLRVDFFRGMALWWIFVDHVPGNWLAQFTLHNFALSDATEIFVLLAGYAAGIVYGRSMDRHGWVFAGADAMRRAAILYVAHIFLFVVFSAQVSYSATALDRADYLEESHMDALAEAPYQAMLEALFLRYQPAFLDILPMYIALLGLFAFVLPLLRVPALLLTLSAAAYLAVRLTGYNLHSWTGGGWFFNPIAWQLLFMIGAVVSYRPLRLPGPLRLYDGVAVLMIAAGLVLLWPYSQPERHLPFAARILLYVDKQGLHPYRLLSILALTWLAARAIPPEARWLRSWWAKPFVLCGQHSLIVFCAGIFLSFLGRLGMEQSPDWTMQALVNVLGALAMFAVALLSAWYRQKGAAARSSLRPLSHADNAKTT